MRLSKNMVVVFKDREEVILKASNDRVKGLVKTDRNEYSTDFLMRWYDFGFVTFKKNRTNENRVEQFGA